MVVVPEEAAEILGRRVAALIGDFGDAQVGFKQQPLGFGQFDDVDVGLDGNAEMLLEGLFDGCRGPFRKGEDFRGRDGAGHVLLDVQHHFPQPGRIHRQIFGRGPFDDFAAMDAMNAMWFLHRGLFDHDVQHSRGVVSDPEGVRIDAGYRHLGEGADHRVVVDAQEDEVLRDVESAGNDDALQLEGPDVAAAEHGDWLGQLPDPFADCGGIADPVGTLSEDQVLCKGKFESIAIDKRLVGAGRRERLGAIVGERGPRDPKEGEVGESSCAEEVRRLAADLGMVGVDHAESRACVIAENVDDRDSRASESPGMDFVGNTGDHAIMQS